MILDVQRRKLLITIAKRSNHLPCQLEILLMSVLLILNSNQYSFSFVKMVKILFLAFAVLTASVSCHEIDRKCAQLFNFETSNEENSKAISPPPSVLVKVVRVNLPYPLEIGGDQKEEIIEVKFEWNQEKITKRPSTDICDKMVLRWTNIFFFFWGGGGGGTLVSVG